MSVLQRLYDSEINVWVTLFWDDGFYVRLGDEMNGFRAEGRCDTWAEIERWLDQQARVTTLTARSPGAADVYGG
jgi:hypothetical protein